MKKSFCIKLNQKIFQLSPPYEHFLRFLFHWRIITIIGFVYLSTNKARSVGLDTGAYINYFNRLKNNPEKLFKDSISSPYEFLYTGLNSLLVWSGAEYWSLLFIISVFVSISIVFFVNKFSTNKQMSLILYVSLGVFAQSLSANRQIIAMAIMLFVIYLLYNKKVISSVVLIVLASFFHSSALYCLIFIPLRYIKPKWWIVLTMFVLTVVGSFAFPYIMLTVEKVIPTLDYYTRYFVNYKGMLVETDLVNNLYSIALCCVFVVLYLARFKFLQLNQEKQEQYDFFLMIFVFVPMIRIAGFLLNAQALLNRLSMYFFMILIVLIPLFVEGLKYNKKLCTASWIMVYIIAFGYMYYLYAIKLSCGVCPYKFVWEK